MNKNVAPIMSALAVVATFSVAVVAQEMKPDRAIKYRQGIMQAIGWNIGVLGGMAKGEIPYNKEKAVRSATFVSELSAMPFDGFVPVSSEDRRRPGRTGPTRPSSTSWQRQCRPKRPARRRGPVRDAAHSGRRCRCGKGVLQLPRRLPEQIAAVRRSSPRSAFGSFQHRELAIRLAQHSRQTEREILPEGGS